MEYGAETIRTLSGAKLVSVKDSAGRHYLVPPGPGMTQPLLD